MKSTPVSPSSSAVSWHCHCCYCHLHCSSSSVWPSSRPTCSSRREWTGCLTGWSPVRLARLPDSGKFRHTGKNKSELRFLLFQKYFFRLKIFSTQFIALDYCDRCVSAKLPTSQSNATWELKLASKWVIWQRAIFLDIVFNTFNFF